MTYPTSRQPESEGDERYAEVRSLYAAYARRYDRRFARYNEGTLREALEAIAAHPPRRLVDVACGTGLLVAAVRDRWPGTSVVGVDLSPDMLEQARTRLPESDGAGRHGLVSWRVGRAEALPVESRWADTLVCTNAFHLVREPGRALAEFRRVLEPGGRLVLLDWCADHRTMRAMLPLLGVARPQHRTVRTLEAMRRELEAAGFEPDGGRRFKVGVLWGLMVVVSRAPRGGASSTTASTAAHEADEGQPPLVEVMRRQAARTGSAR